VAGTTSANSSAPTVDRQTSDLRSLPKPRHRRSEGRTTVRVLSLLSALLILMIVSCHFYYGFPIWLKWTYQAIPVTVIIAMLYLGHQKKCPPLFAKGVSLNMDRALILFSLLLPFSLSGQQEPASPDSQETKPATEEAAGEAITRHITIRGSVYAKDSQVPWSKAMTVHLPHGTSRRHPFADGNFTIADVPVYQDGLVRLWIQLDGLSAATWTKEASQCTGHLDIRLDDLKPLKPDERNLYGELTVDGQVPMFEFSIAIVDPQYPNGLVATVSEDAGGMFGMSIQGFSPLAKWHIASKKYEDMWLKLAETRDEDGYIRIHVRASSLKDKRSEPTKSDKRTETPEVSAAQVNSVRLTIQKSFGGMRGNAIERWAQLEGRVNGQLVPLEGKTLKVYTRTHENGPKVSRRNKVDGSSSKRPLFSARKRSQAFTLYLRDS